MALNPTHLLWLDMEMTGLSPDTDRKTKTAQQLAARIAGCNANTGAGLFPEDEAHVAAYLNQQYYKFK